MAHIMTEKKSRDELVAMGAEFRMSNPDPMSLAKPAEYAYTEDGRLWMQSSNGSFYCGTPYEHWTV